MTAMIGPVSVQNADLRQSGITVLFFGKIKLDMEKIPECFRDFSFVDGLSIEHVYGGAKKGGF
jgi:hypothetical protein